jgi:4-amino-4-deoxy-L-arabinose transferase-like glycosyltransferase
LLPYDPLSLVVALVALILIAAAWLVHSARARTALALVVLAGGLLRLDAGWQRPLHHWDEQFHALVAKNLMADPLTPTLYRRPAIDHDFADWTKNHIWLHKPPLALWAMAASMRAFGVGAVAMRLPSITLATAAILLTWLIGTTLFDRRVALLAASFHAVNGFVIALAAGRRVADHVDTALIVLFELAVWLAVRSTPSIGTAVAAGAAVGLAVLAKSFPGLLVLPVILLVFARDLSWPRALARTALAGAVAVGVALPWTIYTWLRWPTETEWETVYTVLHVSQLLEAAPGGPLVYVQDLPRFFGELTAVSLVLSAVWLYRRPAFLPLAIPLVWFAVPYAFFSSVATRMPAFVMVSAPAIFLLHANAWWTLRGRVAALSGATRAALWVLLVLMAATPVRYLFEPTSVLERRNRDSPAVDRARGLQARLGGDDAVIFNMPGAIEVMFYSPFTIYESLPSEDQARRIAAAGRRVVIYLPDGAGPKMPADWPVSYLTP